MDRSTCATGACKGTVNNTVKSEPNDKVELVELKAHVEWLQRSHFTGGTPVPAGFLGCGAASPNRQAGPGQSTPWKLPTSQDTWMILSFFTG